MSAGKKLLLAISPLVILSIALIIFSYQSMRKVQAQIPDISEFAVTSTELIQAAKTNFDRQSRFYEDVVFMDDVEAIENAKDASKEIEKILKQLRTLSGISGRTQSSIDDFLSRLKNYTESANVVYVRMSEDEAFLENTENAQTAKNLGEEKTRLSKLLNSFSEMVRSELSQKIASVSQSAKKRNNINSLISFVVIGISVLLIFILIQCSVTRPLVEAHQKLQEAVDALWGEMELAKKIQTVLLPDKPEIHGYDIAATMEPSEEVGGDYYDVISVGGYDWIIIGDVSGHGVTAGLVMMMAQTAIHTIINENPEVPPSRLLSVINKSIYSNIEKMGESKHMTIVVMAAGKDGKFSFSGLHEDILIWRAQTRKMETIESNGMWIGLEPDISGFLSDDILQLQTGDCMVLFTDGITEARCEGGELFGDDRLIKLIEKSADQSASQVLESIIHELESCETPDDVTLLVMKRGDV